MTSTEGRSMGKVVQPKPPCADVPKSMEHFNSQWQRGNPIAQLACLGPRYPPIMTPSGEGNRGLRQLQPSPRLGTKWRYDYRVARNPAICSFHTHFVLNRGVTKSRTCSTVVANSKYCYCMHAKEQAGRSSMNKGGMGCTSLVEI